jgi:DNA-binding NarL/FixJ family response regulator
MTKFKVVLADDHQFLLEGIMMLLKDDPKIDIVATAINGIELMTTVAREKPALVILDLNMPGYDGLQCLEKIKKDFPGTRVLVLTNYGQPELVEEVRLRQADGYLIKNSTAAELREAVSSILEGKSFFPEAHLLKSVPDDSYFFDEFLRKYQLTKREIEIIRLICREMSTREIASALFLSELTINTHRRNILRKLEVKNVAGLMNFAKQNQLL